MPKRRADSVLPVQSSDELFFTVRVRFWLAQGSLGDFRHREHCSTSQTDP